MKIIRVEVSPASPLCSLGRRLLFNLSHLNWHVAVLDLTTRMMIVRTTST